MRLRQPFENPLQFHNPLLHVLPTLFQLNNLALHCTKRLYQTPSIYNQTQNKPKITSKTNPNPDNSSTNLLSCR